MSSHTGDGEIFLPMEGGIDLGHIEKTKALDAFMADLGFVVPVKGFLSYDLTTIKNIFNEIRCKVSLIEDLSDGDEELEDCEERVRELEERLDSIHSKEK